MSRLREVVRASVVAIDAGGQSTARVHAEIVRAALAERGLGADCHVVSPGNPRIPLNDEQILEWYAGQLLAIVDGGTWFAMNAWINCAEKFAGITPA